MSSSSWRTSSFAVVAACVGLGRMRRGLILWAMNKL